MAFSDHPEQVQHVVRNAIDGGIGIAAVSSPVWLNFLETYLGAFMLLGGSALLIIRILIAWREWKKK